MIPVLEPILDGNEAKYVNEALRTGWVSSLGPFVEKFEGAFRALFDNRSTRCISVSNGTVALEIALRAYEIGVGDRVIVPNFTFGATVNAVLSCGAVPLFVEPDPDHWCLGRTLLRNESYLKKAKAIILVPIYGVPIDVNVYETLRKNYPNLIIVEDCAEAIGTYVEQKHVGSLADAATFSFFGNKTITTGEGGMIVCFNEEVSSRIKIIKNHGMSPSRRYRHEMVGTNGRMTNIQAAIGLGQMERLEKKCLQKREIRSAYGEFLKDEDFQFQKKSNDETVTPWLNTILFKNKVLRDKAAERLNKNQISYRLPFSAMENQPAFLKYQKNPINKTSQIIYSRGLSLPSSVNLTKNEIRFICDIIKGVTH